MPGTALRAAAGFAAGRAAAACALSAGLATRLVVVFPCQLIQAVEQLAEPVPVDDGLAVRFGVTER